MNPGIGEELGKATNATIDALKSTPVLLALVIFNVLFMAMIGWIQHANGERWERLLNQSYESCGGKN